MVIARAFRLSRIPTYDNIEVKKLECVGHYQKIIGTRLRKLKKRVSGLRGRGRLTDATIDRLQNFFGIAIRQNTGNLKGMKIGIVACLFHVASNTDSNHHDPHCPILPTVIKPVFEDLLKDEESDKCLHGKTQKRKRKF